MRIKKNSELFSSILYIVIGALLVIFKSQTIGWAMTIAGAIFIISGILDLVKQNYTGGAVSLIIGIAILVLGWVAAAIVLLVLGILIALKGVVTLVTVIKRGPSNALALVFPVLAIVIGALIAFGRGLDIFLVIGGVLLAVDGAIGLIGAMKK